MKRGAHGFSLVELMVVVFVIGILSAIVFDQYNSYLIRATRSATQAYMLTIASKEEEFAIRNRSYVTGATAEADLGLTAPSEVTTYYSISVDALTNGFRVNATVNPGTRQTPDGNLAVDHRGVKTPPDKWK